MQSCPLENNTQHYHPRRGFGPVTDEEWVLFAIFEKTNRDAVEGKLKLTQNSFEDSHLKRGILSLARARYITRYEFEQKIVAPASGKKGALVGIARASVSKLRSLRCEFILNDASIVTARGLCIIDLVGVQDFDSHATAGYCHGNVPSGVAPTQLGKRRTTLRLNMALIFSDILSAESLIWPTRSEVLWARIKYVFKRLFVADTPSAAG